MDLWVIFLIAGIAFAVGEMASLGFFLAPFAVGALLAAVIGGVGAPDGVAIVAFLVASGLGFGVLRPIAQRHTRMPPAIRTGTQALIGQSVVVQEAIDNEHETGSVKLSGELWTARSYLEGHPIPAGTRVEVIEIKGATALVTE